MSDFFNAVSRTIRVDLGPYPMDTADIDNSDWLFRSGGSIMPPSPGVNWYQLEYAMDTDGLHYIMNLQWRPFVHELFKRLPQLQISHRSRQASIAVSSLRVNEMEHRLANRSRLQKYIDIFRMPEGLTLELYNFMLEEDLKSIKPDKQQFVHYVKEHELSHAARGVSWALAMDITNSEYMELFEAKKHNYEELLAHPGLYNQQVWNSGLRGRNVSPIEAESDTYEGHVDRTRVIKYIASMSTKGAFMSPNTKIAYQTKLMNFIAELADIDFELVLPIVEGGTVYSKFSETYKDYGPQFNAFDAVSWDSVVPSLLGSAFNPFWVYYRQVPQLASGSEDTTNLGTALSIWLWSRIRKRYGTKIIRGFIHGDDQNMFIAGQRPPDTMTEYQPIDTQLGFMLGLLFAYDPLKPRICGIKASSDRAGKMIHIDVSEQPQVTMPIVNKVTNPGIPAAWYNAYFGIVNGRSFLEVMKNITAATFIAPSEMLQPEKFVDQMAAEEVVEIAQQHGYKGVVVV